MKSRLGIALLITMGFIALITAVVFGTLSLMQQNLKETQTIKNLAQTQLVIKNFQSLLETVTKDIKNAENLELFLDAVPPTVSSDDLKFILDMKIQSMHNRININAMMELNTTEERLDQHYERFLRNLFAFYHLQDPDTMIALIVDTLDTNDLSTGAQTERKLIEADFSDGHISNLKTLRKLGDIYASLTKDASVNTVEWEKYFSFGPTQDRALLDCNRFAVYDPHNVEHVSLPKLLEWQFPLDENGLDYNCTASNDPEIIKGYNIGFYTGVEEYLIHLDVQYELEGKKGAFDALYNMKDKTLREITIKPAL